MHLTVISPFPPTITGIGQYGYHITRSLAETGAFSQISVLAGADQPSKPRPVNFATVDYCWRPEELALRRMIISKLKNLKPDLAWFNLGASAFGRSPVSNLMGMTLPGATRKMGIPTVVTLHELVELTNLKALQAPGGALALFGARLLTWLGSRGDITCLTLKHYAEWLARQGVHSMAIPIGAYNEPQLMPETNGRNLLFFTTLAPYKGLHTLVSVLPILKEQFPNLSLTIAGARHARFPNYEHELRKKIAGSDGIRWLGQVGESQIPELFEQATAAILPYEASTGSSSVIFQAATWGRPVIASDLAEHLELARENNFQIQFFKSGDASSLQQAIRTILASAALRGSQSQHNFRSIQHLKPLQTSIRYIKAFNLGLEKHQVHHRLRALAKEMNN